MVRSMGPLSLHAYPKLPLTAEWCVTDKVLCIEALYECVYVTFNVEFWVVNKTNSAIQPIYHSKKAWWYNVWRTIVRLIVIPQWAGRRKPDKTIGCDRLDVCFRVLSHSLDQAPPRSEPSLGFLLHCINWIRLVFVSGLNNFTWQCYGREKWIKQNVFIWL